MPRKRPRFESYTENKSVKYACGGKKKSDRGELCLHYKLNGIGKMAKPDQLFVTPNGYNWFVEFKRLGEDLTRLQAIERDELIDRGQLHSKIDTFEEFKFKLDWLLKLPVRKRPSGW